LLFVLEKNQRGLLEPEPELLEPEFGLEELPDPMLPELELEPLPIDESELEPLLEFLFFLCFLVVVLPF